MKARIHRCKIKINISNSNFGTGLSLDLWLCGNPVPKLPHEILWFYQIAIGSCHNITDCAEGALIVGAGMAVIRWQGEHTHSLTDLSFMGCA